MAVVGVVGVARSLWQGRMRVLFECGMSSDDVVLDSTCLGFAGLFYIIYIFSSGGRLLLQV